MAYFMQFFTSKQSQTGGNFFEENIIACSILLYNVTLDTSLDT